MDIEEGNPNNPRAVTVRNCGIVGHVPREAARTVWYFLKRGGSGWCEITLLITFARTCFVLLQCHCLVYICWQSCLVCCWKLVYWLQVSMKSHAGRLGATERYPCVHVPAFSRILIDCMLILHSNFCKVR